MTTVRLQTYPRSAYLPPPAEIRRRTTAESRGWLAGYPDACPRGDQLAVVEVQRPGSNRVFRVRVDARLADLVGFLMSATMQLGYPIYGAKEHPDGGVGSANCRPIRGTVDPAKPGSGQPSNHSSATAVDINSRGNPLHRNGPFVSTQPPWMIELWCAALFYPGLFYGDAMHFEFMARPEDVARAFAAAKTKFAELKLRLFGGRPTLQLGAKGAPVRDLQRRLNEHGADPQLPASRNFGELTAAAVLAFQAKAGLPATGIVDAATWTALDADPAPTEQPPVEPPVEPPADPCADCQLQLSIAHAEAERLTAVLEDARSAFTELEADAKAEDNAAMQRTLSMAHLRDRLHAA